MAFKQSTSSLIHIDKRFVPPFRIEMLQVQNNLFYSCFATVHCFAVDKGFKLNYSKIVGEIKFNQS